MAHNMSVVDVIIGSYLEQALQQVRLCFTPRQLHQLLEHINNAAVTQLLEYQVMNVLLGDQPSMQQHM